MKKILYLHGYKSRPGGTKPTFMKSLGYEVINPSLPDDDFNESVQIARRCIKEDTPDMIVGSSRGGAVAMAAARSLDSMILVCPAWKKFGVTPRLDVLSKSIILHSKTDDVVLHEDSNYLFKEFDASLISCGEGHRMIDEDALKTLKSTLEGVLFCK